ncbi:MAG TPA: alpha/beta fold hydrolase [Bdellovibrionales bacterium]|nr:alpha/beta fold hydrolase [Bdellovibrionales bacterium]
MSAFAPNLQLEPCEPPPWARSGHAQTVFGHFLPSPMLRDLGERVTLELPDGDRLVAYYRAGLSGKTVYLFHGLSGSTEADYIHRTAILARAHGHSVYLANHRGCGPGAGFAKHPYHSGRAEDLSAVIAHGRTREPGNTHLAIGFSLSGNALLLLMSGGREAVTGPLVKPDAAISVNAPIDLADGAKALREGLNRIYDLRFVHECRKDLKRRRKLTGRSYQVPLLATLYDFDAIYTGPAGGFKSREDYYESCSTKNLLSQIDRPTLMLTAKDDPFVRYHNYAEARLSEHVHLHAEDHGGHMGYLSKRKTPLGSHRWLDYALNEAMLRML